MDTRVKKKQGRKKIKKRMKSVGTKKTWRKKRKENEKQKENREISGIQKREGEEETKL